MKDNKRTKLKVAVTGGIGAGKSAFCGQLEKSGYPVVKVDDVSKDILSSDPDVKKEIIKTFGINSFKDDMPDKKFLAEVVFSDPSNVMKINAILHPIVIKRTNELISELQKKNDIVFAEAALIYEADMEDLFDYVVLVTADEDIRMKRKMSGDDYTEEQFRNRDENQIRDEEKRKRADFVFVNNGSLDELVIKTGLLINILKGLSVNNA